MREIKLEVDKTYRTKSGDLVNIIHIGTVVVGVHIFDGETTEFHLNGEPLDARNSKIVAEFDGPDDTDTTVGRSFLKPSLKSILQEAEELINGDRRNAYGDARASFENIAAGWRVIFRDGVTPERVTLAMIWLKVCRENNKHKRDNIVDIAGYAALIEKL